MRGYWEQRNNQYNWAVRNYSCPNEKTIPKRRNFIEILNIFSFKLSDFGGCYVRLPSLYLYQLPNINKAKEVILIFDIYFRTTIQPLGNIITGRSSSWSNTLSNSCCCSFFSYNNIMIPSILSSNHKGKRNSKKLEFVIFEKFKVILPIKRSWYQLQYKAKVYFHWKQSDCKHNWYK